MGAAARSIEREVRFVSQGPKSFQRHAAHMARIQRARAKIQARKTVERGLLIVHTGRGKGKSSSAFGMAVRSLGWGRRVAIVQYVKGKWHTGEAQFFRAHANGLTFEALGEGFTWDTQDRERDIAAARAAWERSKQLILDPAYHLVILDELNVVLRTDTLPTEEVLDFLRRRPLDKHVCITGRDAKPALIELADLVTEFREIKHPYEAGFKAQQGIEY